MAQFNAMVLTNQGLHLQAQAQVGGSLTFTSVVAGTGYLEDGQDPVTLTELIAPVTDINISITDNVVVGDGTTNLKARVQSGNVAFYLREIGVMAKINSGEPILYAYANAGDTADFIPATGSNTEVVQDLNLYTIIGNAENVSAVIAFDGIFDGSITTAKYQDRSVTSEKIAVAGVRTENIEDGAVTYEKIDESVFDSTDLTGEPTAPTASTGTSNEQIANTAFVMAAIAALVNSAPSALDTIQELANALGNDANFATTITNLIATKAPLANPALTGVPTAPTASASTNSTQLATTAFVQAVLAAFNPANLAYAVPITKGGTGATTAATARTALAAEGTGNKNAASGYAGLGSDSKLYLSNVVKTANLTDECVTLSKLGSDVTGITKNSVTLNYEDNGCDGVLSYYKNICGEVSMYGILQFVDDRTISTIFTLPTGYRPATGLVFLVPTRNANSSESEHEMLNISSNGSVSVAAAGGNFNMYMSIKFIV